MRLVLGTHHRGMDSGIWCCTGTQKVPVQHLSGCQVPVSLKSRYPTAWHHRHWGMSGKILRPSPEMKKQGWGSRPGKGYVPCLPRDDSFRWTQGKENSRPRTMATKGPGGFGHRIGCLDVSVSEGGVKYRKTVGVYVVWHSEVGPDLGRRQLI